MKTLLMLKGLPGSGKTTYARELVDKGWKRINKDDYREMLDNGKWSKSNEEFILATRNIMIAHAMAHDYNIVIDDTNFAPQHEETLRQLAENGGYKFEVQDRFCFVPLEECIKRDAQRAKSVGRKVITQMHNQYLRPKSEVYQEFAGLPRAIICDIDGTLAHGIGVTRKPHEYDKVLTDTVDPDVRDHIMRYPGHLIFMSGRPEACREDTEKWLAWTAKVPYTHLFMRSDEHWKNQTKDYIVKRELFNKHIRGKYNIDHILDDRDQVVEEWLAMGLKVWQVAEGNF